MGWHDPIEDVIEQGWYCTRCEQLTPVRRRLNGQGLALLSAALALGIPLWATTMPALREKYGNGGLVAGLLYLLIVGSSLVSALDKKGPARSVVCDGCEGGDVVPATSARAERLVGGSRREDRPRTG